MLADLWKWFFLSSHIGFYRSSTRMSAVWVFCIIGNQLRMTTINWFFQSLRIHLPHICWKCICVYWCMSIWTLTAPASPPPSEQVVWCWHTHTPLRYFVDLYNLCAVIEKVYRFLQIVLLSAFTYSTSSVFVWFSFMVFVFHNLLRKIKDDRIKATTPTQPACVCHHLQTSKVRNKMELTIEVNWNLTVGGTQKLITSITIKRKTCIEYCGQRFVYVVRCV